MGIDISSALGGIAGAIGNVASTMLTNKTNKSIATANNAASIELANTAHQREVKDLQAAGLNPILSAGGQGAATPALQQAQMQAPQLDFVGITNAIANMEQAKKANKEAELTEATTKKTDIETQLAPRIAEAQIALQNAQGDLAKQKKIREKLESDIQEIQKEYYEKTGTAPNMGHFERETRGIFNMGKKGGYSAYGLINELGKEIKEGWNHPEKYGHAEKWNPITQRFDKIK